MSTLIEEVWSNGVLVDTIEHEVVDAGALDDSPIDSTLLAAAEEARRSAFDAVIAAGTLTNARVRDATRAGSDAFLTVLAG